MHTTDATIAALLAATASIAGKALESRQNATDAEIGALVQTVAAALRKGASGPSGPYRID
jgi:hypothetical protein